MLGLVRPGIWAGRFVPRGAVWTGPFVPRGADCPAPLVLRAGPLVPRAGLSLKRRHPFVSPLAIVRVFCVFTFPFVPGREAPEFGNRFPLAGFPFDSPRSAGLDAALCPAWPNRRNPSFEALLPPFALLPTPIRPGVELPFRTPAIEFGRAPILVFARSPTPEFGRAATFAFGRT